MDIDLLSKMVKELILDNDRVALPGLGCFVAELVPSTFSDKGYTINPPYRRLYFRSKPDNGDELVKFYAQSNNVSFEMADRIVTDFVAEMKSVLHLKKTVVFPGLGRLRATKENNVFFVADEDLDIYPDGFGLEPISLKTNQETPEEVSAAVEGLKSILQETAQQSDLQQMPESSTEPESVLMSVAEPVQEPEQKAEQEPELTPIPVQEPEPVQAPEPVPAPEPAPEPKPASKPAQVSAPKPVRVPVAKRKRRTGRKLFKALGVLLTITFVLLAAYAVAARIWPEFFDALLYTEEELEIINYIL